MEASPDIRLQSVRWNIPAVRDFVISHYHFDHMHGLYELHTFLKHLPQPATVHCSARTAEVIQRELGHLPLSAHVVHPFESFILYNFTITPLPVYHEYAVDDALSAEALENTFGYLIECEGQRVAYLADYYRVPERVVELIYGIPILIADGTYLGTDEFKATKRNHMHGNDIFSFLQRCGAQTNYYHSISHLTQKKHSELMALLPPSHVATHDGMWILD